MRTIVIAAFIALAAAATAAAAPVDQPYRGLQPVSDFPAPVWAEANAKAVWLDAVRVRSTFDCPPFIVGGGTDQCGFGLPLPGSGFNAFTDTRAGFTVKVGDLIRFHLPGPPATRPVLDTGVKPAPGARLLSGVKFTLGTTDAPWVRIKKTTRSGVASLTTPTGTYWFKLSIRR
jgi:hypothetical protein